jgi:hypothetical protein
VLVFTNRRLLHILVNRNGTWKKSLRSTNWGDVEEAKAKGFLGARLQIKYRNGKKEVYSAMARNDANKVQLLLETLLPAASGETTSALAPISLCPECRSPLSADVYECPHCRIAFKDEKTALLRSWLIPGGGFFYTGHALLGVLHGFAELSLIITAGFWLLVALGVTHTEPNPGEAPVDVASALVIAALIGGILVLEKWVMATVAKKQIRNYIPQS